MTWNTRKMTGEDDGQPSGFWHIPVISQKATSPRGGCGQCVRSQYSRPRLALVGWHNAGRGDEMHPVTISSYACPKGQVAYYAFPRGLGSMRCAPVLVATSRLRPVELNAALEVCTPRWRFARIPRRVMGKRHHLVCCPGDGDHPPQLACGLGWPAGQRCGMCAYSGGDQAGADLR